MGLSLDDPIPHLLTEMEWHGVVVLVIADLKTRDAFSLWFKDGPVIGISAGRSGDRNRMSVAHELAHLVLHAGKTRFEVDEREAEQFAAEFLLPESSFRREIKIPVTLASLADLKARWIVSILRPRPAREGSPNGY